MIHLFFQQLLLWCITWGWYQSAAGLFISSMSFIVLRGQKSLPAIVFVVTSYWSAFSMYLLFLLSLSLTIHCMGISSYSPGYHYGSAFFLASVFTLFQITFYYLMRRKYRTSWTFVALVTMVSNGVACMMTSYFII